MHIVIFPPISNVILAVLDAIFLDEEVSMCIVPNEVGSWYYGIHAAFFQSNWHVVGASVCHLVRQVFEKG